jgi:hypothetical protein
LRLDSILLLTTAGQIHDALVKAPVGVDHVYKETIDRIKNLSRDVASPVGLRAISWIHAAKRPLSDEELRTALACEQMMECRAENWTKEGILSFTPTVAAIVTACIGLVVHHAMTETFAFSHVTVKEYLDISKNVLPPDVDKNISRVCLQYLSLVPKPQHYFSCELFMYASCHWYEHVRDETEGSELSDLWKPMLRSSNSQDESGLWLQCHWLHSPQSVVETASLLRIKWLLGILLSEACDESRGHFEAAMHGVAQHWPTIVSEMLYRFCNLSDLPSEKLAQAIAAAGEHGARYMERIVAEHPYFQVTENIVLDAAKSTQPGEMLQILCIQCSSERARDAITTVRFSPSKRSSSDFANSLSGGSESRYVAS